MKRGVWSAKGLYVRNEIQKNQSNNALWKDIRNCIPCKEVTQQVYTKDKKLLVEDFKDFLYQLVHVQQKRQRSLPLKIIYPKRGIYHI